MVDWSVAEQSPTTRKVAGYVYNRHGEHANQVRMLAQAVDQSGTVTGQRIAFVPGGEYVPSQRLGLHLDSRAEELMRERRRAGV